MKSDEIQKKYGNLKIVWHTDKLKSFLTGEITAPLYVRVKPTNLCDHKCFYCSYDPEAEAKNILSMNFNRKDFIPREKMMEILSDFKDIGVKAITYSGGGEPLIYKHITEAFEKTLEYGIDLSIITNGQNLSGRKAELLSHAKWVRASIDAANKETFERTRGIPQKKFEDLSDNIENFAKIKEKSCELGVNFVIHHLNSNEVYDAAKYFHNLGVNHIKFTPRWIEKGWREYHEPFKESVIEQIAKAKSDFTDENFQIYDTYENDFKLTGVPERLYEMCAIMQTVPVIGADCKVYFCHDKTYTNDGALGSIKDRSFKDLWFSDEAKEIFRNFKPKNACRHHCTYDARNILVKDIINSFGEHINFI